MEAFVNKTSLKNKFFEGNTVLTSPIPGAVKPIDATVGSPKCFDFLKVQKPGGAGNLLTGIHGKQTRNAARARLYRGGGRPRGLAGRKFSPCQLRNNIRLRVG